MANKESLLNNIYTYGLIILPIVYQYRIGGFSVLHIFSIITVLWFCLTEHKVNKRELYWPYIIYTFITTFVILMTLKEMSISLFASNIVFMTLLLMSVYILAPKYFDEKKAYKLYTCIVYIVSTLLLVQFILYNVKGIRTSFIIPGLTLNYGGDFSSTEFIQQFLGYQNFRVSSVFIEPTMYAAYVLPWIFLSLFNTENNYDKHNIIRVLLVTVVLCLGGSSYGIFGAAIAWALFAEMGIWRSSNKLFVLIIPFILLVGYWVFNTEIVQTQISLKMGSLNNLDEASSTSLRLLRGLYCFKELDLINKFFGCGYGVLGAFFDQHGITTIYDSTTLVDKTFMSSGFRVLCQSGIVGSLLYFTPFVRCIKRYKRLVPLFICFIFTILTSSTLDMPSYFLQIIFILRLSISKETLEFNNN